MTRSIAGARPGRRTSAALAAIALTVSVVAWPGCTAGGPAGPADDAVDAPDGGGESLPEASPDAAPDALPSDLVFPDLSQPDGCQVAVDLTGRYFVTLELAVSQLGANFQELYEKCALQDKESVLCKDKADDEKAHRLIVEEKLKAAENARAADKKSYTDRLLQLEQELDRLNREAKPSAPLTK